MDVVIVAYNSRAVIDRSVRGAMALPMAKLVVVVENGLDGSGARARELGAEVVALGGNPGFGSGQNEGARRGSDPLLLMLNPDAEPDPGGVAAGVAFMSANRDVAAVQGSITNRATGLPERSQGVELGPLHLVGRVLHLRSCARFRLVRSVIGRTPVLRDHVERIPAVPVDVESLAATALLVRRSAFDEVGGFDERFFLYGEDLDLCRRLRSAGWRLVALPDRWAIHTSGESSGSSFDREWEWWRGTLQFAAFWWRSPAWSVAVCSATVQAVKFTVSRRGKLGRHWNGVVGWAVSQRRAAANEHGGNRDHEVRREKWKTPQGRRVLGRRSDGPRHCECEG